MAEETLCRGQFPLGVEHFPVRHGEQESIALADHAENGVPGRRGRIGDGVGDRSDIGQRLVFFEAGVEGPDKRSTALGLDPDECGVGRDHPFALEVGEAPHETEQMTARAQRDEDGAGRAAAELEKDLESREFVALHPVGIYRVHERDAQLLPDLETGPEEGPIVAIDGDKPRAVNAGDTEAGHGRPFFEQDEGVESRPGAVSRCRSGHVPRRDRADPPDAEGDGLLDGYSRAPVLEARRRILGFVLGVDAGQAEGGPDALEPEERRQPFAQAQPGIDAVEGQEVGELFERERPVFVDDLAAGADAGSDEQGLAASGTERGVGISRGERAAGEAFESVHLFSPAGMSSRL